MGLNRIYRYTFSISLLAFIAGVIFLFPWMRYYINEPDSFGYISVAEKYAAGNISGAINGTWSPLISIILGLLLRTGIDVLLLFKLVQIALSLSAFVMTYKLIQRFKIDCAFQLLLLLVLLPWFWFFGFTNLTGDLLLLNFLLLVILLFTSYDGIRRNRALRIGVCGGFLYWAKAYGIFFFPLLLAFAYLQLWMRNPQHRKTIIQNAAISTAAFVFVCGIWITAISVKYGRFTYSDASTYNSLMQKESVEHPQNIYYKLTRRLINPELKHLTHPWEDPAQFLPQIAASYPLTVSERIAIAKENFLTYYYFQFRNQVGWVFLLAMIIGLILIRKKFAGYEMSLLIFVVLVYPVGYLFIHFIARYVFLVTLLMALLTTYVCYHLYFRGNRIISILLFTLISLLLIKRPLKGMLWVEDLEKTPKDLYTAFIHYPSTLKQIYLRDKVVFDVADSLKHRPDLHGKVVSRGNSIHAFRDSYSQTMTVNHFLNNVYYGQLTDEDLQVDGLTKLQQSNADFYYVWEKSAVSEPIEKNIPLLFADSVSGLRIYKLKP
jgi:hypothetical protein